jgi:hypothetical protein
MELSIPAKFYCFMATTFLRADIQTCQKTNFLGTGCFRKSGITSALIEIQSSFYAHFKANKMPFPMIYYTNIFRTVIIKSSRATSRVKWLNVKEPTFRGQSPSSSSGY